MADRRDIDAYWARVLRGDPFLRRFQSLMRKLPAPPRCKLCAAPFGGPGGPALWLLGKRQSKIHPRICTLCSKRTIEKKPGGAETELSVLFADVRGSTALAERVPAEEFAKLLNRFYETVTRAVDDEDGLIDRFVGDGVIAPFIPGFVGPEHAGRAVAAGRRLLEAMYDPETDETWLPVGIGVHTGVAYTGVVGLVDAKQVEFTAIGDASNVAARLATVANAGELLVSSSAAAAAGLDGSDLERRHLKLKGRAEELDAFVIV